MKYLAKVCCAFLLLISSSAMANFDATIPVIDMKDYFSKQRHKVFIADLAHAMKTVGFVAIINTNVDKKILDTAYLEAKKFYAQPLEVKMLCHGKNLNGQRGYVQSEVAKNEARKDHKEFFHVAREYPEGINKKYNYPENIWPKQSAFKPAIQNLITELDKYIVLIESAVAESIGEQPDFFNKITKHGAYVFRSIHYPANPPADNVWAAAHTDINLISILPRATAEGLQILNAKGEWIDVIVPDGAFIVNAGDMLQNITNGIYKSSMHRVVSKSSDIERYSMVAFVLPRPNDPVAPLSKFVTTVGEQKFANVTCFELLSERLIDLGLHSQELLETFAKSGAIERLIGVKRASPAAMRALRNANLASAEVLTELQRIES